MTPDWLRDKFIENENFLIVTTKKATFPEHTKTENVSKKSTIITKSLL